jgi:hypothetical protein
MNSNLEGGFVMAGVGVAVALIAFLLYCFIGLDCHLISKEEPKEESVKETTPPGPPKVDAHGNPIESDISAHEGEGEV